MKTSLRWLRQYFDFSWSVDELAEALTLAGLEVEGIERPGKVPDEVVVGEILERQDHPNANRLSLCRVEVGAEEPLQIVCGAANCQAGCRVPVALSGAELAGGLRVRKAKLRGVESAGMMCSAAELGLGQEHDGLLQLPKNAVPGRPAADYLQADTVIDWEVTPNRPDWLSHLGIAREIAALAGRPDKLRLPKPEIRPAPGTDVRRMAAVEVADPELCPRYTARVLTSVKIGPSPDWLQQALTAVGVRPINNVVDVTNYVMMECGQPLHAFDYDKLRGGRIIVRRAKAGEQLVTLDGQKHQLHPDRLVIADTERAVALAGVMGGAESEIVETTTTVLLESAAFNPANIRATVRALGIGSESSYRFERGVGLETVEFASRRATALIQELAGAEVAEGCLDVYPRPWQPDMVPCRIGRLNQLLGTDLEVEQVAEYCRCLGLTVAEQSPEVISVNIPSFRLDLQREADLIEEVARLYGLDNIPAAAPVAIVGGGMAEDAYVELQHVRDLLLSLGLTETMTYSTIGVADALRTVGGEESQLIKLANPISAESACMRPSLLPGLLRTVSHNIAHNNHDLAIFEMGRVVARHSEFGEERYQVGIAMTGSAQPERYGEERRREYDFFDLKGVLEEWFERRGRPCPDCLPSEHPALLPGRTAEMIVDQRKLAIFGQVRDELVRGMRLNHPLFLAVLELEPEFALERCQPKAQPLAQFPSTSRDISMIVPDKVRHRDIVKVIEACRCPWLEEVRLFDLYRDGQALGPDRRSLAYSLVYRHSGRTLTDDEANTAHEQIKSTLAAELPVEFR